jgi:hypothetical protein
VLAWSRCPSSAKAWYDILFRAFELSLCLTRLKKESWI